MESKLSGSYTEPKAVFQLVLYKLSNPELQYIFFSPIIQSDENNPQNTCVKKVSEGGDNTKTILFPHYFHDFFPWLSPTF